MPVAHVCPCCGNQLARIRAVFDATYCLPIVRCDCGHVAVRRRHPVRARSRRAFLIAIAVAGFVLQLLLVAFFSLLTVFCVRGLTDDIRGLKHTPLSFFNALVFHPPDHERLVRDWGFGDNGFWALAGFAALSLLVGVWLRVGLAHWRWPRQIPAWIALVSALLWIEVLVWPATWTIRQVTSDITRYKGPSVSQSLDFAAIFAASLLTTLLGTPIGYGFVRLAPVIHRYLFARRLAKLRKRRHAG